MITNTINNYLIIIISTTTTIVILTIKSAHCLLLTSHLIEEWAVGDTDIFDNILNGLHIIREAAVILYWKRIRGCSKITKSLKGGVTLWKNTFTDIRGEPLLLSRFQFSNSPKNYGAIYEQALNYHREELSWIINHLLVGVYFGKHGLSIASRPRLIGQAWFSSSLSSQPTQIASLLRFGKDFSSPKCKYNKVGLD